MAWQEDGHYPDAIVAMLSESTVEADLGIKKEIYFVFDPFDPNSLQGWHLDISQGYQPLEPNERGVKVETLHQFLRFPAQRLSPSH